MGHIFLCVCPVSFDFQPDTTNFTLLLKFYLVDGCFCIITILYSWDELCFWDKLKLEFDPFEACFFKLLLG